MTRIEICLKVVVEVMKILNRLGHSVSLSAKEDIDTASRS